MRGIGYRSFAGSVALATTGFATLGAQVREGARTSLDQAEVTFGYVCDDRFVVSNEGSEPVRLEYGVDRSDQRTPLDLAGRESVELLLSSSDQLNLMADGRIIATAHNERRSCDDGRPRVVVRRPVVSVQPTIVVVRSSSWHRYYDGWWGRRHHHRPVVRAVIRFPIIIGRNDRDHGRDRDRGRDDRGRGSDRRRGR